jgi:hypothetical protein
MVISALSAVQPAKSNLLERNSLKLHLQAGRIKAAPFILGAVFLAYFVSDAVLRQFVLYRAGTHSISLNTILEKLPAEIRDEVRQRVLVAELKDKLLAATTDGEKITTSIALANAVSDKALQQIYAEIIDKYPSAPESVPAFANYLMAPETALKSISIPRYHQYLKQISDPELFYAFDAGYNSLKNRKVSSKQLFEYLLPLLDLKPACREYQRLYIELSELAFQEGNQDAELKARKLDEYSGKLAFFDRVLGPQQAKKVAK